jgi:hypothetical protein
MPAASGACLPSGRNSLLLTIPRFSFGVGDRFAREAEAQLAAFEMLEAHGVVVAPVWNKSNREHSFIGSQPASVREAAAAAVAARGWAHPWFVDADHIRLDTVEPFLDCSDFFTIDVADSIGQPVDPAEVRAFVARHPELSRPLAICSVLRRFFIREPFPAPPGARGFSQKTWLKIWGGGQYEEPQWSIHAHHRGAGC